MLLLRKNQMGFTMVELMIVVSVVGALAMVALPAFKKYQSKSKTSEAKLHLASAFTSQQAFWSEYNTFHICLRTMGYNPVNETMNRYYTVGFGDLVRSDCAECDTMAVDYGMLVGPGHCDEGSGQSWFAAGKPMGTSVPIANFTQTQLNVSMSVSTFNVGAMGVINDNFTTNTNASSFTMDHRKVIRMVRPGY